MAYETFQITLKSADRDILDIPCSFYKLGRATFCIFCSNKAKCTAFRSEKKA